MHPIYSITPSMHPLYTLYTLYRECKEGAIYSITPSRGCYRDCIVYNLYNTFNAPYLLYNTFNKPLYALSLYHRKFYIAHFVHQYSTISVVAVKLYI